MVLLLGVWAVFGQPPCIIRHVPASQLEYLSYYFLADIIVPGPLMRSHIPMFVFHTYVTHTTVGDTRCAYVTISIN
jgi:hypothetical protein